MGAMLPFALLVQNDAPNVTSEMASRTPSGVLVTPITSPSSNCTETAVSPPLMGSKLNHGYNTQVQSSSSATTTAHTLKFGHGISANTTAANSTPSCPQAQQEIATTESNINTKCNGLQLGNIQDAEREVKYRIAGLTCQTIID